MGVPPVIRGGDEKGNQARDANGGWGDGTNVMAFDDLSWGWGLGALIWPVMAIESSIHVNTPSFLLACCP